MNSSNSTTPEVQRAHMDQINSWVAQKLRASSPESIERMHQQTTGAGNGNISQFIHNLSTEQQLREVHSMVGLVVMKEPRCAPIIQTWCQQGLVSGIQLKHHATVLMAAGINNLESTQAVSQNYNEMEAKYRASYQKSEELIKQMISSTPPTGSFREIQNEPSSSVKQRKKANHNTRSVNGKHGIFRRRALGNYRIKKQAQRQSENGGGEEEQAEAVEAEEASTIADTTTSMVTTNGESTPTGSDGPLLIPNFTAAHSQNILESLSLKHPTTVAAENNHSSTASQIARSISTASMISQVESDTNVSLSENLTVDTRTSTSPEIGAVGQATSAQSSDHRKASTVNSESSTTPRRSGRSRQRNTWLQRDEEARKESTNADASENSSNNVVVEQGSNSAVVSHSTEQNGNYSSLSVAESEPFINNADLYKSPSNVPTPTETPVKIPAKRGRGKRAGGAAPAPKRSRKPPVRKLEEHVVHQMAQHRTPPMLSPILPPVSTPMPVSTSMTISQISQPHVETHSFGYAQYANDWSSVDVFQGYRNSNQVFPQWQNQPLGQGYQRYNNNNQPL